MNFDREEFLKTNLGVNLIELMTTWHNSLNDMARYIRLGLVHSNEYHEAEKIVEWCKGQWCVYQILLKQIYGIYARFVNVADLFAIVVYIEPTINVGGTDILIKVGKER